MTTERIPLSKEALERLRQMQQEQLVEPVEELEERVEEPEEEPEEAVEVVEEPRVETNAGDDMGDLFKAPSPDDEDMQTDDLTSVSEEDVFGDGGEDMSDILEVTSDDIMGEDDPWGDREQQSQPKRRSIRRAGKPYHRYVPPAPGMQGLR